MAITVKHYTEVVATVEDDNAAFTYILKHQGMSVEWAVKNEGWSARDEDGRDVFEIFTQPHKHRP